MKGIEEDKKGLKFRYENALYLADGTIYSISRQSDFKVSFQCLYKPDDMLPQDSTGWIYASETLTSSNREYFALTGETSYGGEGFIGLMSSSKSDFKWLIHLNWINNPVDICIAGNKVIVNTDLLYPDQMTIEITIANPKLLTFCRKVS